MVYLSSLPYFILLFLWILAWEVSFGMSLSSYKFCSAMSSLLMSPSETFFISVIVLSIESNDNPLPIFLPGNFHGQRSLTSYIPRICSQPRLSMHACTHTLSFNFRAFISAYITTSHMSSPSIRALSMLIIIILNYLAGISKTYSRSLLYQNWFWWLLWLFKPFFALLLPLEFLVILLLLKDGYMLGHKNWGK